MKRISRVQKLLAVSLVIAIMVACIIAYQTTETKAAPYSGRLTGVNWFGFETGNLVAHGLWARDYKSMLKQIRDLGFNCVRLPWCNDMLTGTPSGIQINEYGVDAYTNQQGLNLDLEGLSSIEVFDKVIQECERIGLYVVLDNHSRQPDGYMNETLWYTSKTPESKWISDWVSMATRYKSYSKVVGFDLNNEPHGNMGTGMKPPATWGYNQDGYTNTDWKAAAEKCGKAILAVNSNALIIVEGVEMYKDSTYWWGGNLKGVRDYPITGIPKANLMYSPHEYGPEVFNQSWFTASDFPNNMPKIWDDNFWFIQKENIGSIFIGEFGITDANAANKGSVSYTWITKLMDYCGKSCSWTFWCMNPNSGDTGGILSSDWVTVQQSKVNILKPYFAAQPSGSSVSSSPIQSSTVPTTSAIRTTASTTAVTTTTASTTTSVVTSSQPVTPSTSSTSQANVTVDYVVKNEWSNGATVSVVINNKGTTINGWNVTWTFSGDQKIGNLWGGDYTQTGSSVSVKNTSYNGVIQSGSSTEFGFNITFSGTNAKPTNIKVN